MSQDYSLHGRRAFDQWSVASAYRRIGSFILDSLIVAALLVAILWISRGYLEWPGHFFFWIVGMWLWEGFWVSWKAQTPGRMPFKIYVHAPRYDGPPRSLQLTLRILNFWCGLFLFGIGLTPILFRRDRRGWHDLLAETVTLGPVRESPSPVVQRAGQSLALLQALTVFSALGAFFVTVGLNPSRIQFISLEERVTSDQCNHAQLFIEKPDQALFAMAVSPAWSQCWEQTKNSFQAVKDSELFRLAALARKYQEVWSTASSYHAVAYRNLIRANEDSFCPSLETGAGCVRGREIAGESISIPVIWAHNHAPFFQRLLAAQSASQRIAVLKLEIAQTDDPIIAQALKDRLWTEELASGRRPSARNPSSTNESWNRDQICWLKALDFENTPGCAEHPITVAMEKVKTLDLNDVSLEEGEYYLAELHDADLPPEFDKVGRLWKAVKQKNRTDAKLLWEAFPQTSPLYSYAQKWYARLK